MDAQLSDMVAAGEIVEDGNNLRLPEKEDAQSA